MDSLSRRTVRSLGRIAAHVALVLLAAGCGLRAPVLAPATQTPAHIATALPSATVVPPASSTATNPATATQPAATQTATKAPTATPTASLVPATATPFVAAEVRLAAVGDLMLARSIEDRILTQGPQVVFEAVADMFAGADLLAGNLECVISDTGQPEPKAYTFRAAPETMQALTGVNFDVVSLANNHAMDYGLDGLADMLRRLREAGIASVGAGADEAAARAPVIISHNGLRVGFLAYVDVPVEGRTGFNTASWSAGPFTPGIAWANVPDIEADVMAARALSDVVVVMMHFGLEGHRDPTSAQRAQARAAIDAGATLVLGAHAHMLQPVEEYNGGVIAYGLGNFVFDGFSIPSNFSAIFQATLTADGVASYEWVPVVVDRGLPRLARPDEAAGILARVATE